MQHIELFNTPQGWHMREFLNGAPSDVLIELFGTHVLPCAFTMQAPAEMVRTRIQTLNPDAVVTIAEQVFQWAV